MSYSIEFKEKAVKLRRKGYSIKEISQKLNISKATSSIWLKNVSLNSKALERLDKRRLLGRYKAGLTKKKQLFKKRKRYQTEAKTLLKKIKIDKSLSQLLCSLLYWAEGGKFTDNNLQFTNSDPQMIRSYLRLLRYGFNIDESKFRANVHIHDYHDDKIQKKYWSNIANIPISQFYKSYKKSNTQKRKRENYPGCVRISYYSANIARKVIYLYKAFAELQPIGV